MAGKRASNIHSSSLFVIKLSKNGWRMDDEEPVFDGVGKPEIRARTSKSEFSATKTVTKSLDSDPIGFPSKPEEANRGSIHGISAADKSRASSMGDSGHYGSDEIAVDSSRSSSASSGEIARSGDFRKMDESLGATNGFDSYLRQKADIPTPPARTNVARRPVSSQANPSRISGDQPPQQMWKWRQKSAERKVEHLNVCLILKSQDENSFGFSVKGGACQDEALCISAVIAGSRADRAGLEIDDQIVTMDGMEVEDIPLYHINALIKEATEIGELELTLKRFKALTPVSRPSPFTRHRRPRSPGMATGSPSSMPTRTPHHKSESSLISPDSGAGSFHDFQSSSPISDASMEDKNPEQRSPGRSLGNNQRAQSRSTGHLYGYHLDGRTDTQSSDIYHEIDGEGIDLAASSPRGKSQMKGDLVGMASQTSRRQEHLVPDGAHGRVANEQEQLESDIHWEKEQKRILGSISNHGGCDAVPSTQPNRDLHVLEHSDLPLSVETVNCSNHQPSVSDSIFHESPVHKIDEHKIPTPAIRSCRSDIMEESIVSTCTDSNHSPLSSLSIGATNSASTYSSLTSLSPVSYVMEETQKSTEVLRLKKPPQPLPLELNLLPSLRNNKDILSQTEADKDHTFPLPKFETDKESKELLFREEQMLRARNELLSAVGDKHNQPQSLNNRCLSPSDKQHNQLDPAFAYLKKDDLLSKPQNVKHPQSQDEIMQNPVNRAEICFSKMPLPWEKHDCHHSSPCHLPLPSRDAQESLHRANLRPLQLPEVYDQAHGLSNAEKISTITLSLSAIKPESNLEKEHFVNVRSPSSTSDKIDCSPSNRSVISPAITTVHTEPTSAYIPDKPIKFQMHSSSYPNDRPSTPNQSPGQINNNVDQSNNSSSFLDSSHAKSPNAGKMIHDNDVAIYREDSMVGQKSACNISNQAEDAINDHYSGPLPAEKFELIQPQIVPARSAVNKRQNKMTNHLQQHYITKSQNVDHRHQYKHPHMKETHWLVQEAAGYNSLSDQLDQEQNYLPPEYPRKSPQQFPADYAPDALDCYSNEELLLIDENTHWLENSNRVDDSSGHASRLSNVDSSIYSNHLSPRSETSMTSPSTRHDGWSVDHGNYPVNTQHNSPQNVAGAISVSGRQQCRHCGQELGRGAAMIIESLNMFYHLACFRCYVCSTPLGNGVQGTDVRVRSGRLHCQKCYSNDEAGVQISEV